MADARARDARAPVWPIGVLRQLRKQRTALKAEIAVVEAEIATLLVDIATLEAGLATIRQRRREEGR